MKIILFTHPPFLFSKSMPRFAGMLASEYEKRGHSVTMWTPQPWLRRVVSQGPLAKWLGYFDQYIVFPLLVRFRLMRTPKDVLFVFCDQALGPWVPLVKNRLHVVHAHDLLALKSALGLIPENKTSLSGVAYQKYIRKGFSVGKNFISVSNKTRDDLHLYGNVNPRISEVVYNGLNFPYQKTPRDLALKVLRENGLDVPENGFLLHVGGSQWYKNSVGVITLYGEYLRAGGHPCALWMVCPPAGPAEKAAIDALPETGEVRYLSGGINSLALQAAYSIATAFLFPSLEEGFGWPIIEAMACECMVVTTGAPPMNEIGGDYAVYLPRLKSAIEVNEWARSSALLLLSALSDDPLAQESRKMRGAEWAKKFTAEDAIEGYLKVYQKVLSDHLQH